jgi:hypothetical protein
VSYRNLNQFNSECRASSCSHLTLWKQFADGQSEPAALGLHAGRAWSAQSHTPRTAQRVRCRLRKVGGAWRYARARRDAASRGRCRNFAVQMLDPAARMMQLANGLSNHYACWSSSFRTIFSDCSLPVLLEYNRPAASWNCGPYVMRRAARVRAAWRSATV